MKKIIIKSQEEFDTIRQVRHDEEIIFESESIKINCILKVYGILKLRGKIDSSWNDKYIESWDSSQTYIVSWGSSQTHIESRDSSQTHIKSWDLSQTHIESRDSSQTYIIVSERSSQTHIVSWGSSINIIKNTVTSLILHGFSIAQIPFNLKIKIKKDKTSIVQKRKPQTYLMREGIAVKQNKVVLYKKVSSDFKTQENTKNETLWKINTIIEHPQWSPTKKECGEGKFHACSKPYFCDEFRSRKEDKYIAVEVNIKDLYEWINPYYPHKIAFRKGKVLFECDKYGNKI